jgi:hypothetical protein
MLGAPHSGSREACIHHLSSCKKKEKTKKTKEEKEQFDVKHIRESQLAGQTKGEHS